MRSDFPTSTMAAANNPKFAATVAAKNGQDMVERNHAWSYPGSMWKKIITKNRKNCNELNEETLKVAEEDPCSDEGRHARLLIYQEAAKNDEVFRLLQNELRRKMLNQRSLNRMRGIGERSLASASSVSSRSIMSDHSKAPAAGGTNLAARHLLLDPSFTRKVGQTVLDHKKINQTEGAIFQDEHRSEAQPVTITNGEGLFVKATSQLRRKTMNFEPSVAGNNNYIVGSETMPKYSTVVSRSSKLLMKRQNGRRRLSFEDLSTTTDSVVNFVSKNVRYVFENGSCSVPSQGLSELPKACVFESSNAMNNGKPPPSKEQYSLLDRNPPTLE